jgi:N,N'-diacetyllegionaminate synthase
MNTLIIAEAGVNHNGEMATAKRLIDAAAKAGADIVKFQTFSASRLTTINAPKAEYQLSSDSAGESQHAMLARLELTRAMHEELAAYCASRPIEFLSTGFDTASVDELVEIGIRRIKIPSGEITNLPYLRHAGRIGKPVILSTGMSTLPEIESALNALEGVGLARSLITVLHCNTAYPTPMRDVNLRAIATIRDAFGVRVGYSDHTLGNEVAFAAVALGAEVIEKHLTLNRGMPGPDHKSSLEPDEMCRLVSAVRNVELAMGDAAKRPSASEIGNIAIARKSLVAAVPIRKGDFFSEFNVTAKRPGTGLSPMRIDQVLGRKAGRDFATDEFIEL